MSLFKKVPIFVSQYVDKKMGTKRTGFIDNSAYLKVKLVPTFMSFYTSSAVQRQETLNYLDKKV